MVSRRTSLKNNILIQKQYVASQVEVVFWHVMACQSDFVSQVLDLSDCPSAYEQLPPTAGCLFREAQAGLREELSTAFQVTDRLNTLCNGLSVD